MTGFKVVLEHQSIIEADSRNLSKLHHILGTCTKLRKIFKKWIKTLLKEGINYVANTKDKLEGMDCTELPFLKTF